MGLGIVELAYRLVALLIALSFHEYAHAKVADNLGDRTARYSGRLTINPLAHIDPVGWLMLWFFRFGWAKPVQVNPMFFRDRKKGLVMVAAAGPAMNLVLGLVTLFILRMAVLGGALGVSALLGVVVVYNVYVAVFNLIPIPPLDGSKVLMGLLPARQAFEFARLEQYGWIVLLLLVWTGIIESILVPFASAIMEAMELVVGLVLP